MKNKLTNKGVFWVIGFLLIFLLSQDYLYVLWEGKPDIFGFPVWMFWFAIVHILFIAFFYWFAQNFWKE